MATQPRPRRAGSAASARKSVMTSVRLDVATHSRMSAAASIAGVDKSRFIADLIKESLQGFIIIDRRAGKSETAQPDQSTE